MSLINNDPLEGAKGIAPSVESPSAVSQVEAVEADRFSGLLKEQQEEMQTQSEMDTTHTAAEELTPEQLQQQVRDSMFRNGFNKAIERAKEIIKEIKS
ncbi:hypothetical protein CI610_03015 [invertebrate metagenome]|uniref:Uncharacterized protein n=1 Tax=invertebrate metagenome TaxID=1711999 RepID=A0A2H9T4A9_9ZZZZ